MSGFLNWLDNRTGYRALLHEALYERIPGGARWRYIWGSTLVFTFVLQMITGVVMWMSYSPSTQTAWESVYYIQNEMTMGDVVRGMHHFAAQAMVVLLALHLLQVIVDGAYKAPREVNFWLGLVLMMIVLGLSLTGYLLPWDQKGYYGTKVATNIMGATPVIGPELKSFVLGGPDYGHHTLTRFFALHAGLLPGLLIFFLSLHIYVFRRHGIHAKNPDRAPEAMFWPDQVLKDAVACLAVLATVLGLALWKGAELGAPADPAVSYDAARPEWYFLFLFRFLKFEAIEQHGVAFGAIYIPGALMTFLIMMPIVAIWRHGHKLNVGFTVLMLIAVGCLTGLAVYEDWYSDAPQSVKFRNDVAYAEKLAERVKELASSPTGIPPEGAVHLLRTDPLTQGPILFAQKCASCHRYDGTNGLGQKVMVDGKETPATATDLAAFGSRKWIHNILQNYPDEFAPLKNAKQDGKSIGPRFLEGEMATWVSENLPVVSDAANERHIDALVEFIAYQSRRADLGPYDEELVELGRDVFENGTLAKGEFTSNCTDCHAMKPRGEDEVIGVEEYAPSLTGYGGEEWLTAFVSNPSDPKFYGSVGDKEGLMPAFGETMTAAELELLVKWMAKDYYEPEGAVPAAEDGE